MTLTFIELPPGQMFKFHGYRFTKLNDKEASLYRPGQSGNGATHLFFATDVCEI